MFCLEQGVNESTIHSMMLVYSSVKIRALRPYYAYSIPLESFPCGFVSTTLLTSHCKNIAEDHCKIQNNTLCESTTLVSIPIPFRELFLGLHDDRDYLNSFLPNPFLSSGYILIFFNLFHFL